MDPLITRSEEHARDAVMIECGMCHRRVPVQQSGTLSGRTLCFGCLSGWYDDEDDE